MYCIFGVGSSILVFDFPRGYFLVFLRSLHNMYVMMSVPGPLRVLPPRVPLYERPVQAQDAAARQGGRPAQRLRRRVPALPEEVHRPGQRLQGPHGLPRRRQEVQVRGLQPEVSWKWTACCLLTLDYM